MVYAINRLKNNLGCSILYVDYIILNPHHNCSRKYTGMLTEIGLVCVRNALDVTVITLHFVYGFTDFSCMLFLQILALQNNFDGEPHVLKTFSRELFPPFFQ